MRSECRGAEHGPLACAPSGFLNPLLSATQPARNWRGTSFPCREPLQRIKTPLGAQTEKSVFLFSRSKSGNQSNGSFPAETRG